MELLGRLVGPGDQVFDVGGHIGYLTVFFSDLVGPTGRVHVFEPGENNLPYLRRNVAGLANTEVVACAAGATDGKATFFVEELTGQNNSLIADYDRFELARASAHIDVKAHATQVEVVRLDTFVEKSGWKPDFVKIDVEGAEIDVLRGMPTLLREDRPALMVEVTREARAVYELLSSAGYRLFDEDLRAPEDPERIYWNVFALHPGRHGRVLADWPELGTRPNG
jgi:FkbM family methyltransferase